jgi:hypothetical protein
MSEGFTNHWAFCSLIGFPLDPGPEVELNGPTPWSWVWNGLLVAPRLVSTSVRGTVVDATGAATGSERGVCTAEGKSIVGSITSLLSGKRDESSSSKGGAFIGGPNSKGSDSDSDVAGGGGIEKERREVDKAGAGGGMPKENIGAVD